MKNIAIILAGGVGSRLGLDKPKQFLEVAGRTILEHSVEAFHQNAHIHEVLIVSNPAYVNDVEQLRQSNTHWTRVRAVLAGGKERYDSSLNAIRYCRAHYAQEELAQTNLIFHDAVRPLVSQDIISRVCEEVSRHPALGVAVPAVDTILECEDDAEGRTIIRSIPDRALLRRMQTPQAFRLDIIEEAYSHALADPAFRATDDCGVVVRYMPNTPVYVVEGEERNIKLTYPEDILTVERLLQEQRQV